MVKELAKWWPTHNRKAFEAGEHGPIHDHRPSLDEQVKALRRVRSASHMMFVMKLTRLDEDMPVPDVR